MAKLRPKPEEEERQLCELLQESEDRIFQLEELRRQAGLERDDYKSKYEIVRQELESTQAAFEAEIRKGNLMEAQLDNDSIQCQREMCVKLQKDCDTLVAEKAQLQRSVNDLSDENHQQTQAISESKKTIQDLNGKIAVINLQLESYKLDFEAERKDREIAHGKLADLEKELAREKSRIDVERAAYARDYLHIELKNQDEALTKDIEKLRDDLTKQKGEADKLREEVRAKASQVRQYKKENDRLKTQVEQYASSVVALTNEIEALKKKEVPIQKSQISTSESVETRIAEESSGHTCFQGENKVKMRFTKKSDSQSNNKSGTSSPLEYPGDTDYKESRTTHLEKRLDKMLLDMQAIAVENERLRDEVYQIKKQPAVDHSVTSTHELRQDVVDSQKYQKKVPPALNLRSHDQESPAAIGNRSRSPSPVAVVTPIFQSPKLHSPYRQQASIGPVMAEALPLAQPISPPLHYNQQQQQRLEVGDDPQAGDGFRTPKNEESDDRPFDPNLVCPKCKQQFRIGEIQEYKRHYKLCHSENKKKDLNSVGQNMAGDTQPFTPIFPTAGHQSGLNEDVQTVKPKLLCRTPGCSFKGYEDLGGLCPDCSGSR